MKNEKITIFTDGASRGNPGPGGWGAVIISDFKFQISGLGKQNNIQVVEIGGKEDNTTNNRMELTAAIEALLFLSDIRGQMSVVIYSDSSYLINGITKWVYSWERRNWTTVNKEPVLNKDLWEDLLELSAGKKISWQHVVGHSNIPGNERADQIATLFAAQKSPKLFSGELSAYPIKILDLKPKIFKKNNSRLLSRERSRAKAHSYLSLVDGVLEKHKNWQECDKRVKGKSGAKFKKALSAKEEAKIIKKWSEN